MLLAKSFAQYLNLRNNKSTSTLADHKISCLEGFVNIAMHAICARFNVADIKEGYLNKGNSFTCG